MAGWGPFDLTGKNAVVTGGAMGIGFGIVKRLMEAGANVLIADVNEEAAQAAVDKLGNISTKAAAVKADVRADDAGDKVVAAAVREFGSLDILVNNAGIYPSVPVLDMSTELFDRVYQINLRGLVFMSKAAGKQMVEQGKGGKIINIASIDAFHPSFVGLAAYDASKGGVVMFTKSFALEMAPHNVHVNGIAPGGISTEGTAAGIEGLTKEQLDEMLAAFVKMIPVGRMGGPDDIGKVAVFLASSASDYMAGEIIIVDGGRLLS